MEAKGWAVTHKGEIQLRTVSPDRRGAIVNWLFIGPMGRVLTLDHVSDDQINRWWAEAIEHTVELRCLEVTITT